MPVIETERLMLRNWESDDFEAVAAMHADAEVMRWLTPDGRPMSRAEAWRAFAFLIGHWHIRGFGMFAVIERSSGQLVGRVGPFYPEGWPGQEVGWTLARPYWGCGYATEAATAAIDFAFDTLGWPHVISLIHPENVRSIRVAERLGEQFEKMARLPHIALDVRQYGISRDAWRQRAR